MTMHEYRFTRTIMQGRQWDVEHTSFPSYKALKPVMKRIHREIEDYEDSARDNDDRVRLAAAERVRAWIESDGEALRARLERSLAEVELSIREEMQRSVVAAVRLADLHRASIEENDESRDLLLQWCNEVLLTLQRAFRDAAEQSLHEHPQQAMARDAQPWEAKSSWDASSGGYLDNDRDRREAVAV